ncbi:MAG: HD domain-containing protein [Gammaproteobacteria bacterium]
MLTSEAGELEGLIEFLRDAERLKDTERYAWTSRGRRESAAEHTWRLCLMALLVADEYPELDCARLLKLCIVHDLAEAIGGDVPAPEQEDSPAKAERERRDLEQLTRPLPTRLRERLRGLWEEYEAGRTAEARLAKALDKLETILQHTQGRNPPGFDYRYNLDYGHRYTSDDPLILLLREVLDVETERRAAESERNEDRD